MLSFIETPLFTPLVYDYLSDEEYAALQAHLAQDPESGEVVPGSGGVRKLRWGVAPNGHLKLPHLWPPKLPQARRVDYASAVGPVAMRWASARIL